MASVEGAKPAEGVVKDGVERVGEEGLSVVLFERIRSTCIKASEEGKLRRHTSHPVPSRFNEAEKLGITLLLKCELSASKAVQGKIHAISTAPPKNKKTAV